LTNAVSTPQRQPVLPPTDRQRTGDPTRPWRCGHLHQHAAEPGAHAASATAVANVHLPVFATSHIYDGTIDATANRDLEGVEFCDAPWLFDAQPGLPSHDDIATQLPAAQGERRATVRVRHGRVESGALSRLAARHPGSYLPGASGQLTADQFGRVRRVLIWAKFQDGLARPLGGSLQTDDVPASAPPTRQHHATDTIAPASSSAAGGFQVPISNRLMRAIGECLRATRLRRTRARRFEIAGSQLQHAIRRAGSGDARRRHNRGFVEVRYRKHSAHGDAAASVTASKRTKLIKAAEFWLAENPKRANSICRFDIFTYDGLPENARGTWLCDAFDAN
jgi:hypothetical protein